MEFDRTANEYNQIVSKAVSMSGDGWEYFARYKARYVANMVPADYSGKILDYGCGVGNLSVIMKELLPNAHIDGHDVSNESLKHVNPSLLLQGTFTPDIAKLDKNYDLIVVANVFHHIEVPLRQKTVDTLVSMLAPEGKFIIFEHNPYNPLTQWSVKHSPLDQDAVIVSASKLGGCMRRAKLGKVECNYVVFFPKPLAWFRFLEPFLGWCPMGAQYALVGSRR